MGDATSRCAQVDPSAYPLRDADRLGRVPVSTEAGQRRTFPLLEESATSRVSVDGTLADLWGGGRRPNR